MHFVIFKLIIVSVLFYELFLFLQGKVLILSCNVICNLRADPKPVKI